MLTYRVGAAGVPSSAERMADHLLQETLFGQDREMALSYRVGLPAAERGATAAEPRRDMAPAVARILGIDPGASLDRASVANLLNGRRADGGAIPGRAGASGRNGYVDLCFSADRSVSLAWAFAPTEAERNRVMQAHRDAVDDAMRYVERELGWARRGRGGAAGADAGRIGWVRFDHYTSRRTLALRSDGRGGESLTFSRDPEPRLGGDTLLDVTVAGDPNLHTHVAVPNVVVTEGGHVGSLDLRRLRGRVKEFGAVYQAYLATHLRRAGAEVVLDEATGAARLPAIPGHVRTAFSKRTRDAHEAARERAVATGTDWDGMDHESRVRWLKGGARASRRARADDVSDRPGWVAQAEALGWSHAGALAAEPASPADDRVERAYGRSLPFVEQDFARRSVLSGWDLRVSAARALVETGIGDDGDVGAVTALMRSQGVVQDGARTALVWGEVAEDGGRTRVDATTAMHRDREDEFTALVRAAAADRSADLGDDEMDRAVAGSGLGFEGAHGEAQLRMLRSLGKGGKFSVAVGVAGAGKTTVLRPLVRAWKEKGAEVYGVALAWRQAGAFRGAGIGEDRRMALAAFLHRAGTGAIELGPGDVVAVDELGQVGVRQMLELARLRRDRGFKVVAIGDDRQAQAIEAGPTIDLLRRALGEERIPEVLSTVRQSTRREREISLLFRAGEAGKALGMKREDGTVELVPGGYRDAVRRVADLWMERTLANAGTARYSLTVSVPTNADARAVGAEIRLRRRAAGLLGGNDLVVVPATDQHRGAGKAEYDLPLAAGDRVRLFDRVVASFGDRSGVIGNNGSVLEVREANADHLVLRTASGREGRVRWESLRDRDNGRFRLAYGDAGTVDSLQGATSTEHIDAMPAGSAALQGFKGYVAESRHRKKSYMVLSDGAERQAVVDGRDAGDPRPVTEADVWENVAENLSRQPTKRSATGFLETALEVRQGGVRALQDSLVRSESRAAAGLAPTTLASRLRRDRADRGLEGAAGPTAEIAAVLGRRAAALGASGERTLAAAEAAVEAVRDATADFAAHAAPPVGDDGRTLSAEERMERLREAMAMDRDEDDGLASPAIPKVVEERGQAVRSATSGVRTAARSVAAPEGVGTHVPSGVDPHTWFGWKLHLNVSGEPARQISAHLTSLDVFHKTGHNSGQDGKGMTVYVGSRDEAARVAADLDARFSRVIQPPGSDVLADDLPFSGDVWGRFDVHQHAREYHQYGSAGVPMLNSDVSQLSFATDRALAVREARERADAALRKRFGEFYAGSIQGEPGAAPHGRAESHRSTPHGMWVPPPARGFQRARELREVGAAAPEILEAVERNAAVAGRVSEAVRATAASVDVSVEVPGPADNAAPTRRGGKGLWKDRKPRRRPQYDKEHLESLKRSVSITHLIGQDVKLGHDGKANCPFHEERTASFHVYEKTGHFHCYGCGAHGDAISWLRDYKKMSFPEVVERLEGRTGITQAAPVDHGVSRAAAWRPVPVPDGAPPLVGRDGRTARIYNPKEKVAGTRKEWMRYRPQHVAEYRDASGRLMGYVVRVEIKAADAAKDRKFTPQVTWVVPSDAPRGADPLAVGRWALWVMDDPRPLYRAERLARLPDAPVVVVAGEKKADALQSAMGDAAVVVSWAGGDHARRRVDFGPLRGRHVTVWPDNDASGIASAVGDVDPSGRLRPGSGAMIRDAGAASVRVVLPPGGLPKGWDAGDLVKSGADLARVDDFMDMHAVPLSGAEALRRALPGRDAAGQRLGRGMGSARGDGADLSF